MFCVTSIQTAQPERRARRGDALSPPRRAAPRRCRWTSTSSTPRRTRSKSGRTELRSKSGRTEVRRAICFYMKQEGYGRGRRMGNGREGVGEGLSGAVAEALGVSECSTPSPPPPLPRTNRTRHVPHDRTPDQASILTP